MTNWLSSQESDIWPQPSRCWRRQTTHTLARRRTCAWTCACQRKFLLSDKDKKRPPFAAKQPLRKIRASEYSLSPIRTTIIPLTDITKHAAHSLTPTFH